ncbi:MAG: YraN family protein [bacterium]|nr:YraN family protein [bacterium]
MADRRALGARGEEAARRHLESIGWRVLHCNFRTPRGEIDLVALDGGQVVFVEVRTWLSDVFGSPAESITVAKQRRMRAVAEEFLARHCEQADVRFDVILVAAGAGGRLEIAEHLRGAF